MADRCGLCGVHHSPWCRATEMEWPTAALIDAVGSLQRVQEMVAKGHRGRLPEFLSDLRADRWAIRCGLHPEMVWPGWCDAALTDEDRAFIESGAWQAFRDLREWVESQRCDLPAGNPEVGAQGRDGVGGREAAIQGATVEREGRVA